LSPALEPGERLRRTERFISGLRLSIVLFNSFLYVIVSPSHAHQGLAWTIIVIATLYALLTVFWDPAQLGPNVVPVVNMVLDNLLIAVWLYATGGYESPFFMLFYAEAAATVGRFGWKVGGGAAVGSALLYLGVVLIDGNAPLYEVAARVAYIFFIVAFVAYVVENARAVERDARASEATNTAYEELTRIKAAFVATVSHELRTPLTTIKGATTTLLKNEDRFDPVQVRTLLEMVERQSGHLGKLIQDLIDIASLEQGEIRSAFEWSDVQDIVLRVVDALHERLPQEVEISVTGDAALVRCDPALIGRVLHNLVDNASKFSPSRDAIKIEISFDEERVHIDVIDRGIGIEAAELERVFDRFYQVDSSLTRQAQGAGIGLNIARELARQHRGDIEVVSTLGEGARFRLTLPIDPDRHLEEEAIAQQSA
jgi:signal transduction histidine kinase